MALTDTYGRRSILGSLLAGAALLLGCGTSAPAPTATDASTDARADASSDVSDAGGDASAPLFLLTVQGTLRAAGPDAGAPDAGPADGGAFNTDYARTAHNGIVGGFMSTAMMAGDLTHHTALGLADGSQFLALDTWNNLAGLTATVSDPAFQAAFGSIFTAPPTTGIWVPAAGYTSYTTPATGSTRIYVMVRATLRSPGDGARTAHNGLVASSMATAVAGGDVSHTVWLNPTDPAQFLAIDVWTNPAGLMGFLSDPTVMAALGQLFSGAPTVTTYSPATGWTAYGTMPAWGTL